MSSHPSILLNPPLKIVALELRFPETMLLPEDLKKIRKELVKEYPLSDTEQGFGIEISVQGLRQQPTTVQRHVYRTRDGSQQVALAPTSLVLEGSGVEGYEGFEHFLERWLAILDIVQPVAEINDQLRLGLRYINQLPVDDASAGLGSVAGRINPVLLSPMGADGFDFSVVRSFQELRLMNDHGKATLRHGLQAEDGVSSNGVYVLDIDFYEEEIAEYSRESQVEQLKRFNFEIWKIFRWSLTEKEYERMEPQEK
jgi:uncharacterized protein (TIGR04255 family)